MLTSDVDKFFENYSIHIGAVIGIIGIVVAFVEAAKARRDKRTSDKEYQNMVKEMNEKYDKHDQERDELETKYKNWLKEQTISHETDMIEQEKKLETQYGKSYSLGGNRVRGIMSQVFGSIELLDKYEYVSLVSNLSVKSIDALGIKKDSVDFIKIKTGSSPLTESSEKIKKLIDEKKINYVVMEAIIPKEIKFNIREIKNLDPAFGVEQNFADFMKSVSDTSKQTI